MSKSYRELIRIPDFIERFRYLSSRRGVGEPTFGYTRWLNQVFYKSPEWRRVRNQIIIRDNGNDLAHEDFPIMGSIYVHHINPITEKDIDERSCALFDPDNLVLTSLKTHNALHYGDESLLEFAKPFVERTPGDTTLW